MIATLKFKSQSRHPGTPIGQGVVSWNSFHFSARLVCEGTHDVAFPVTVQLRRNSFGGGRPSPGVAGSAGEERW